MIFMPVRFTRAPLTSILIPYQLLLMFVECSSRPMGSRYPVFNPTSTNVLMGDMGVVKAHDGQCTCKRPFASNKSRFDSERMLSQMES